MISNEINQKTDLKLGKLRLEPKAQAVRAVDATSPNLIRAHPPRLMDPILSNLTRKHQYNDKGLTLCGKKHIHGYPMFDVLFGLLCNLQTISIAEAWLRVSQETGCMEKKVRSREQLRRPCGWSSHGQVHRRWSQEKTV